MTIATWLLFLATDVALSLTPGPAVLFVIGTGLRRGLPAAIGANLGILFANTIYFVLSAFGLGLLLSTAEPVFVALKWLGAAYLVWLAIGAFRAAANTKARAVRVEDPAETVENRDVFDEPPGTGSRRVLEQGFPSPPTHAEAPRYQIGRLKSNSGSRCARPSPSPVP